MSWRTFILNVALSGFSTFAAFVTNIFTAYTTHDDGSLKTTFVLRVSVLALILVFLYTMQLYKSMSYYRKVALVGILNGKRIKVDYAWGFVPGATLVYAVAFWMNQSWCDSVSGINTWALGYVLHLAFATIVASYPFYSVFRDLALHPDAVLIFEDRLILWKGDDLLEEDSLNIMFKKVACNDIFRPGQPSVAAIENAYGLL